MELSQKQPVDTSSQDYAEYQYSAPEVAAQYATAPTGKFEGGSGHGYQASEYPIPVEESKRKRILGLAPWLFFTLTALIVLVIVGAVVGGVVGTRKGSSNSKFSPFVNIHTSDLAYLYQNVAATESTSTQLPTSVSSQLSSSPTRSSTSSGTSTSTATSLAIIDANYAGRNITSQALAGIQQGPNIVVNMTNTDPWGTPDPWFSVKKCLSILYSYGSTIRTFVACESNGAFNLAPGSSGPVGHVNDITRQGPSSRTFAIVSIVWGASEITDGAVYQSVYSYKINGSAIPFTNELFGKDTFPANSKSGVIWYTDDNFSTFKGIFGREGANVTF